MAENRGWTTRSSLPRTENENEETSESIENVYASDDNSSNTDWTSEMSSSGDSDSEDYPLDERLRRPTKYFQELDNLESKVFANSMFKFYVDGTTYKPFDGHGHVHVEVGHGVRTQLRKLNEDDIKAFSNEVLNVANEAVKSSPSIRENHNGTDKLDRSIENLMHLIECRHIILRVVESIEAMETASYCGGVISMLVVDKSRQGVARLLPIQCSKIKQLATAFETSLSQLMSCHTSTVLLDTEMAFADKISEVSRDLFFELGLDVPVMHCTELWRCAVHVLDVAVLSYAGAHTQFFGMSGFKCFTLPGPFIEQQYFMFRRRSFVCLGDFLGQDAWVLEWYYLDTPQLDLPKLYLSTDAKTFGDIWGPMWKTCALLNGQADPDHILRYSVGNGVILPWNLPASDSQNSISSRKDEVFCHWVSGKDIGEVGTLVGSSGESLHTDNILLIGASKKLQYNPRCDLSSNVTQQRLRDSGHISELGTIKSARVVDSEAVEMQVGPPYVKAGAQRTYKRRGRTWKEAVIENWKNNPEGRNVRILEYRFGVEVSACTYNARRRRLITLLGSSTMLNYLRNGSLRWNSTTCEESFYAALEGSNHRAFRHLYISHKDWQSDLGKAITYCLDGLKETGLIEQILGLLWVPGSEPGQKVNIRSREHNWIGFLRDTEECCTMAILEDKCLELLDLAQVRKCQNRKIVPGSTIGSITDENLDISVLETSFMLNQNSIPNSMKEVPCHGHNGSISQHKYRWSTSSLRDGDKFLFGENGRLKCVKSLRNGQMLANWESSWDLVEALKDRAQGSTHAKRHREYIRNEKGGAGPMYVLIASSGLDKTASSFTTSGVLHKISRLGSNLNHTRQYVWKPSESARPRTSTRTTGDTTRDIMSRWMRDELALVENLECGQFREVIDGIAAALTVHSEENRGGLEQEMKQERDQSEDI